MQILSLAMVRFLMRNSCVPATQSKLVQKRGGGSLRVWLLGVKTSRKATTDPILERVEFLVRLLREELGASDDSNAPSWLNAVESREAGLCGHWTNLARVGEDATARGYEKWRPDSPKVNRAASKTC